MRHEVRANVHLNTKDTTHHAHNALGEAHILRKSKNIVTDVDYRECNDYYYTHHMRETHFRQIWTWQPRPRCVCDSLVP
jgi:hypothetical protein